MSAIEVATTRALIRPSRTAVMTSAVLIGFFAIITSSAALAASRALRPARVAMWMFSTANAAAMVAWAVRRRNQDCASRPPSARHSLDDLAQRLEGEDLAVHRRAQQERPFSVARKLQICVQAALPLLQAPSACTQSPSCSSSNNGSTSAPSNLILQCSGTRGRRTCLHAYRGRTSALASTMMAVTRRLHLGGLLGGTGYQHHTRLLRLFSADVIHSWGLSGRAAAPCRRIFAVVSLSACASASQKQVFPRCSGLQMLTASRAPIMVPHGTRQFSHI